MTKDELIRQTFHEDGGRGVDYAIPQPWLDQAVNQFKLNQDARNRIYDVLAGGVAWSYRPEHDGGIFGVPLALTTAADEVLDYLKYAHATISKMVEPDEADMIRIRTYMEVNGEVK